MKQWKPKPYERYWYFEDTDGLIECDYFELSVDDYHRFNDGNCFATREEMTNESFDKVMEQMKRKYEND